ncbi:MAG: EAL domain-containing protein [Elainellaceae cyanobacterium]
MLTTKRKRPNHGDSTVNWLTRIDEAFASDQLRLYGQVIVQSTGRGSNISYPTVGLEVLLRLVDTDGSFVNLSELLSAVEQLQLTERIDYFVLQSVISRIKKGALFCPTGRRIFINLSSQSMSNSAFLTAAADLISSVPAIAAQLCIEITETHALRKIEDIRQFIEKLKPYGCRFALDDFGSGFASFTYLKTLPVDYVKIDGSFVLGVAENPIDFAIVRAFSEIGQMMGKTIIAEWVETDVMAQRLRMIGIDRMQGHAFGRPMPLDELI